ncbi:MAG: sodium:solute symporter, partial [Bacteroidaceae bacterium]|nr:sodium:solute symporter [Bacteroidaceae bacterium]
RNANNKSIPYICVAAPIICGALDYAAPRLWGFTFGYELLMFNGIITFVCLYLSSKGKDQTDKSSEV